MNIINSNAKNNALKLLRRYHDPYECWTGLKSRYESDSGPRRVMLIDKFFALQKIDSISMDAHLTEVREIANLLEEVDVNIHEDIIVYYTLKHLPKEYEIFKRMQISGQTLPTYEQLEAKLISEETAIKIENQDKDEGEAFFLHRQRRPQSNASRHQHVSAPQRHSYGYRRHPESGGSQYPDPAPIGGSRYPAPESGGTISRFGHFSGHPGSTQARNSQAQQIRFRPRGPERPRNENCNYCGLDGHFERECDLKSILDRMKEYEHRLQEQCTRTLNAQAHHIEEPLDLFNQEQKEKKFQIC